MPSGYANNKQNTPAFNDMTGWKNKRTGRGGGFSLSALAKFRLQTKFDLICP